MSIAFAEHSPFATDYQPIGFIVPPQPSIVSYSVYGHNGQESCLIELMDVMSRLKLSSQDLLERLKEKKETPVKEYLPVVVETPAPSPSAPTEPVIAKKGPSTKRRKRTVISVSFTVGYIRKLNNFLTAYCGGSKRLLVEEFAVWCQEQSMDDIFSLMNKYLGSPVRKHHSAQKKTFYTTVNAATYTYLIGLAHQMSLRFRERVSVGDIVRGLVFSYTAEFGGEK